MNKWLDRYQDGRQVVPISDNTSYRKPIVPISKQEMFNNLVGVPKFYQFNSDPNADAPGRRALSEEYATKYKTKKALKKALKVADVTTDIMQLGNFIPLPQAQAIGKLGNVLGTGIDAFQGGMDVAEGNYGSAGINFASAFLPKVIENYGYKRDMFNTTPGSYADKIANLGSRSGEYIHLTPYIQHINNPAIMKGVNFNRGLLGALGSETAIDLNQKENGGLVSKNSLNRNVTCSNCGWSWKLSDGGLDPMTCHKCGGDIKMKEGGELDEYKDRGQVQKQVIPNNPYFVTATDAKKRSFQGDVTQSSTGPVKINGKVVGEKIDPYVLEKSMGVAAAIPAAVFAAPSVLSASGVVGAAMNAPLAGVAGLTGSNILNAGFATHGLKSVLSGDVAKPWQQAYESGNGWDYANAAANTVMTGMELFPLVGPAYKGALGAFNYLNKQSTPYILSNRFNKLIKNTDLSKLNNFTEQSLIPRLDLLDKSSIGVNSDINELYKNNPEKYNELINHLFNKNGDLYLRPIIRFKNTQPHSYIENLTLPSKNKTLFKEKMCPPESECAKTANSVNNYLFKEITGKPFDYNANAHNAWHMEDQMIKHGGKNVTSNVIIGDRLLMGNGVDQSTYVPGMIADPNIRHAGVYAGDILHNGSRFPMVMESGKNSPLYLNPINYTFTGENTVLKAIRPSQHNNSDYLKSLVEKNMRYAYRNKPSIYNSFSFNKDAQNIISKINTHRDEIKNTYDLTNDEFDALRNSLIGIGAQETKLGTTLPGSIASKAKIQLQDILVNTGLSAPIKQVKGNVGKVLNKLNQSSSELLSYPGSAYIEKEAAILSQNSNRSFEESLAIVKNKYQPKPKFSENTTSPSKGIFRQKFQTDLDKLADVNSNDEMRNAMGQMALNYQKAKKLYPEASPSQLVDITTLMWNSPGKAVNKELTDFYLFGNKNPNPLKFKFDYIDKVNKYKNKLIENPINKHGLEKHFEIFNEEGPEIYYKNGGPIVTPRGQWDYPGQTTIIPSNQITMQGVPYPVVGVDNTGHTKMMHPGMNYTFPGQYVTEYPMAQNGKQVKKSSNIVSRKNVSGDALTSTLKRELVASFPYLQSLGKSIEKGISYITPDYKSQEDRELLFRRHRPVEYPSISSGLADVVRDYSSRIFNTEIRKPFRDKEGDYEASEEAWRMTLGLPVKSKYIIPSAYRPLNETNKASKYYTLNEKMYNKDLLRKKVEELKLKPGQSALINSFAPFINENYMNRDEFSQVDPIQNFQIGVNKKGKMYFYDKYDFDFEPATKVVKPYEYEFYNEFKTGGEMIKRADGSYSKRGLWDNIRDNRGSGKAPTKQMLDQERKIRNQYQEGGEQDRYWRTKQPMVNDPSMDAISKVLLYRNQDKNFMQRAAGFGYQGGIPSRYIPGEDPNSNNMSSLLMSSGDNQVFPTIIQTAPSQLSYQPYQSQEYIEAPTEDIADYFAAKGYKRAANDMYGMNYRQGGSVTLNTGGEQHKIYVKSTNRGEGNKGHIMVNHPTMDKGMWDTIDLTQKAGAKTIAQGVAATKEWHRENPYMKQRGGERNNNLKNINLNLPVIRHQEMNPLHINGFLANDRNENLFIGGINPRYQNEDFSVGPYMIGVGNKYFQKFPADMGMSGTYHVNDNFDINMGAGQNNINAGIKYNFANGGYVVRRSHDRKGKTHVVTGPDGTKKYFGDPNMGERGNSKYGKEAFYARHKSNLAKNPYFRAYARATWEEGGEIPLAQNGVENIISKLNPYNWGVDDYTDKGSFNNAYAAARKAGEKEFMWNNKRINTNMKGSADEQLKTTGIIDDVNKNIESTLDKRIKNNIYNGAYYDDYKIKDLFKLFKATKKEDDPSEMRDGDMAERDLLSLYLKTPLKYKTLGVSKYKPSITKGDKEDKQYYKINKFEKTLDYNIPNSEFDAYIKKLQDMNGMQRYNVGLGDYTIDKGKDDRGDYISYYDKWDINPFGQGKNAPDLSFGIGTPFDVYDRIYYKDYGDGNKKKMYYSDKELSELDIDKKNFDTLALQRELSNRGIKLPKSTKKNGLFDGSFDGILGDETKIALLNWQNKNKMLNKKAIGGQTMMNPVTRKDNRNWLEFLKN